MVASPTPLVIERLDKTVHDRRDFDCGEPSLNDYLKFTARQHMDKGYAQVWVAVSEPGSLQIIGYYTLSMSALQPEEVPGKVSIKKISVVLLGRLAVDNRYKGQKVGLRLLFHAQRSALLLSRKVGVHALVVDALDEQAAAFYQKYDFEELITGPLHLYKTIKDIAALNLVDGISFGRTV
ncbi:MAG: GNAT family N-acetyltransferase [Armatimonadota bacterium]